MKGTKRKQVAIMFIISLLAMFCMGVGLSYAYFTATLTTTEQTITFGKLELNVSQMQSTDNNTRVISLTGTNLCQGDSITVDGKIMLGQGSVNAFVRMRPEITMTPDTGKTISDDAVTEFETLFVNGFFALCKDENSVNCWQKSTVITDDYYYCYREFESTKTSGASISIGTIQGFSGTIPITSLNSEWQGATVKIKFIVEAIQSKGAVADETWTSADTPQLKINAISQADAWSVIGTDGEFTAVTITDDMVDETNKLVKIPVVIDGSTYNVKFIEDTTTSNVNNFGDEAISTDFLPDPGVTMEGEIGSVLGLWTSFVVSYTGAELPNYLVRINGKWYIAKDSTDSSAYIVCLDWKGTELGLHYSLRFKDGFVDLFNLQIKRYSGNNSVILPSTLKRIENVSFTSCDINFGTVTDLEILNTTIKSCTLTLSTLDVLRTLFGSSSNTIDSITVNVTATKTEIENIVGSSYTVASSESNKFTITKN